MEEVVTGSSSSVVGCSWVWLVTSSLVVVGRLLLGLVFGRVVGDAPIIIYHWVLQLPFLGGGSLVVGGVGCSVHRVGGVGRVVTILEGDMASPLLKFPFLLISCALQACPLFLPLFDHLVLLRLVTRNGAVEKCPI